MLTAFRTFIGYVFLSEDWFAKYSKDWHINTTEIDKLLVDLVKYAAKDTHSDNLQKIKAYLESPPETVEEAISVWRGFYDSELKVI